MSDLKLYSVNWQDGMLITQKHLKDQESYFEELARWHALPSGDRYGLVKKSYSGKPTLTLNLSISGSRLRVEVVRCQAIMPDGRYVEINGTAKDTVRAEAEITDTSVPVFLGVDPSAKKQVGDPDPGEDLPRVPYLISTCRLSIGQPPNLSDGSYIQVAELQIAGSEVVLSPAYFPPCLTTGSDERLAAKTTELRNHLENLLLLSTRAYKAVSTTGGLAGASTSLQVAFKEMVSLFAYHTASTIDEFMIGPNARHPLEMVVLFKKVFRVFSTLVNLHPGLRDYLNEKYFTREAGTDVDRFLSSVEAFILKEYNHRDLGGQVQNIDEILNMLRGVMAFLAQTKRDELGEQAVATETLTYQARTYRNVAYGGSRLEQVGELSYLLIDIAKPSPVSDAVILMSKNLFTDTEWRSMQVRMGVNEARGLGETDPVDVDTTAFGNKVALHPRDMLESSSVRQVTLIFRGVPDPGKFENLGGMDLIVYAL